MNEAGWIILILYVFFLAIGLKENMIKPFAGLIGIFAGILLAQEGTGMILYAGYTMIFFNIGVTIWGVIS